MKKPVLAAALMASVACVSLSPLPAHALLGFGKKQAAPQQQQQYYIHDAETFKANTKPFHEIPFNDPKFEYDIQLPNDWTVQQLTAGVPAPDATQTVPTPIARFQSPMLGTMQAEVTVSAARLANEISVENWLKNYMGLNGWAPLEKITVSADGRRATTSFVFTQSTASEFTRMTAQLNGDVMMITRFDLPLPLKEPLGFLQQSTLDSFRLIMPTDDTVETHKTFVLGEALKFSYPQSWEMRYPDTKDPNRMTVHLYNKGLGGRIDGVIRVSATRRAEGNSLTQEMALVRKYFNDDLGIVFKTLVSSDKAPAFSRFAFSRYEVYEAASKKSDSVSNEARLAVLGDKDWYITILMLSPSAQDSAAIWARDVETFDQIVKKLR